MCKVCFGQGFPQFDSWQAFEGFEQELRLKDLIWRERPVNWRVREPLAVYDPEEFRQCGTCGQVWALSSPDNAWRGYFLPEELALMHIQQLRTHDKAIPWGCIGVIVAGLLLIFVRWVW